MNSIGKLAEVITPSPEMKPIVSESPSQFRKRKPAPWLVKYWLKKGKITTLYGASGSLKSFLALDMALSIAYHVPFLGKFPTRPGKAAYVYSEAPDGGPQRVNVWMHGHGLQ